MDSEAWRLLASEVLRLGVWVTEPWRDSEPFLTACSGFERKGGRVEEGRGPGAARHLAWVEESRRRCRGHWLHCGLYRRLVLDARPEVRNRGRVLELRLITVSLVMARAGLLVPV